MKSSVLVLCLAAAMAAAHAQTAARPAASKSGATARSSASAAPAVKYPPGKKAEPQIRKTLFSLRVQDLKIGTGPEAEPMKMYKVKYTGWRAADGVVFDSWDQHEVPIMGTDGKPEMGPDGKPKMGPPTPATFPVGMGRMIPGFDQGFAGMRVGGIRRIFVPWQLGYGTRTIPERPDRPGIPPKSDLVFDVELVDISDLPMPPNHPFVPGVPHPGAPGQPSAPPPGSAAPHTPPSAGAPSTPPPPSATPQPQSSTPPQAK